MYYQYNWQSFYQFNGSTRNFCLALASPWDIVPSYLLACAFGRAIGVMLHTRLTVGHHTLKASAVLTQCPICTESVDTP